MGPGGPISRGSPYHSHNGTASMFSSCFDDLENLLVCASYKGNKSEYCKMKDLLSFFLIHTEVFKNREKLLQLPTSKSECSKNLALQRSREVTRVGPVPR